MRTLHWLSLALAAVPGILPAQGPAAPEPPLNALLDSASLHEGLAALAVPRGERAFRIAYDAAGARTVEPIRPPASPADDADAALQALLESALRPLSGGSYATVLLLEAAPTPRITRPPAVEEPPRLRNGTQVARQLHRASRALQRELPGMAGRFVHAHVELILDTDGSVLHTHLVTSTGVARADEEIVRVAPLLRFQPARLDGEPVKIRVLVPITLEVPPPNDPRDEMPRMQPLEPPPPVWRGRTQ